MTVKELREKYKLTQSALAKSLGVTSNTISVVEAGRLKLSSKLTAKIKEVYGEDVAAAPALKAEKADKPAEKKEAKTEKAAAEPAAEAAAEPAEKAAEAAPAAAAAGGKKTAKPPKKAAAKKKPAAPKPAPAVILQSPFGGEITVDAIKTLVGDADKIYVRIDQNKLYWVKGEETGDTDIW
jgi:DNA-binding XRE family transcriptional regulator